MAEILLVQPDYPVDAILCALLSRAYEAAASLGIDVFVGGATARDIMLTHVHARPPRRATRDVDLCLCIERWAHFDELRTRLIDTGEFFAATGAAHRLHYRRPGGIPLDLIPFGAISEPTQSITWPPDHVVVLNVAGFEEALACAEWVDLGSGVPIPVCSLACLSVLKLHAWLDRRFQNNKDAIDFFTLAVSYAAAGSVDRLYTEGIEFLDAAGYDPDLAGAALLGRDAAKRCLPSTLRSVASILENAVLMQQMQDQLMRVQAMGEGLVDARRIPQFIAFYRMGFASQSSQ